MDDFSELETELKRLRPAPVSEELAHRVERALQARPETATAGILPRRRRPNDSSGWRSFFLGLTAVAALLVIGLTFFDQPPQPQPVASTGENAAAAAAAGVTRAESKSQFQPAELRRVVYQRRDEGLVFLPNDSNVPRRRVRYETRETMQWRNAQTGASLRVSYPAEEILLTPVSFE